ncbi:MAG: hypothetical protein U0232_27525 [Thermomicrobiales bacterium]
MPTRRRRPASAATADVRVAGVPFGIAICREGWRYPETVRWAARRCAGGVPPACDGRGWNGRVPRPGDPEGQCTRRRWSRGRRRRNADLLREFQLRWHATGATTCLIGPDGRCVEQIPYGEEARWWWRTSTCGRRRIALGAERFAPERYGD